MSLEKEKHSYRIAIILLINKLWFLFLINMMKSSSEAMTIVIKLSFFYKGNHVFTSSLLLNSVNEYLMIGREEKDLVVD
jgi:hypothetical protein